MSGSTLPLDTPPEATTAQSAESAHVSAGRTASPLPGYKLLEEVGRGAMGVVYRARDLALDRDVAVKFLQPQYVGTVLAERFLDEAKITGQLQHPGIPPVHAVGVLEDGRPWLAMKLIKGRTLAERLESKEPLDVLGIFEDIARAVGYAHAHGVIHRDLKPANVMVGSFGEVQVMDWGLAKVLSSVDAPDVGDAVGTVISTARGEHDATRAGSIKGTPAFMAPEQAIGAVDQITERTDVFGLGGILCVMLTGRPPFHSEDGKAESTRQLAAQGKIDDAYAALSSCGVEPEILALCLRCLAPVATDRFANGAEVVVSVEVIRTSAEERARQAEVERARIEVQSNADRRRRDILRASSVAVSITLLAGVCTTTWQLFAARGQEKLARQREGEALEHAGIAEANLKQAEWLLYAGHIARAQEAVKEKRYDVANQHLLACPWHLRGWEHDYLTTTLQGGNWVLHQFPGYVSDIAWSPDGLWVAAASGSNHAVKVWSARTLEERSTFNDFSNEHNSCLGFSADSIYIYYTAKNSCVCIRNLKTGATRQLKGLTDHFGTFEMNEQGTHFAALNFRGQLLIWDVTNPKPIKTVRVQSARTKRDDTDEWNKTAVLTTDFLTDLSRVKDYFGCYSTITFRFHPSALRIALGPEKRLAELWPDYSFVRHSLPAGYRFQRTATLEQRPDGLAAVEGHRHGAHVLYAGADRERDKTEYRDQEIYWIAPISQHSYSPSGQSLVMSDGQGRVLLKADTRLDSTSRAIFGSSFRYNRYSEDGTFRYIYDVNKHLLVERRTVGKQFHSWQTFDARVDNVYDSGMKCVAVDLNNNQVIVRDNKKCVTVWDVTTKKVLSSFQVEDYYDTPMALVHGSSKLLVADVKRLSPDDPKEIPSIQADSWNTHIRSNEQFVLQVRDRHSGDIVKQMTGATHRASSIVQLDERRAVTAHEDGSLIVWDLQDGIITGVMHGHTTAIINIDVNHEAKRIVTSSRDSTIRLWTTDSCVEVLKLDVSDDSGVAGATFSNDGNSILSGSISFHRGSWTKRFRNPSMTIQTDFTRIASAVIDPSTSAVVVTAQDGATRHYDVTTGKPLKQPSSDRLDHQSSANMEISRIHTGMVTVTDCQLRTKLLDQSKYEARNFQHTTLEWHTRMADEAEKTKNWRAAAFHLRRLELLEPGQIKHRERLTSVVSHLPKFEEAPAPRKIPEQ